MYVRKGPAVWQKQCDPTRTKQSDFQQAFRTAAQQPRLIAINRGIAWRLMARKRLGRPRPDCAAELLLMDSALSCLGAYAGRFWLLGPDRLEPTVRLVAHLGERWGPPARSRTGPPTPLAPP